MDLCTFTLTSDQHRSKLDEISGLASRMRTGLTKLVEAEKSVNELSLELVVKKKDLAVASKEADEVIVFNVMQT